MHILIKKIKQTNVAKTTAKCYNIFEVKNDNYN